MRVYSFKKISTIQLTDRFGKQSKTIESEAIGAFQAFSMWSQ